MVAGFLIACSETSAIVGLCGRLIHIKRRSFACEFLALRVMWNSDREFLMDENAFTGD